MVLKRFFARSAAAAALIAASPAVLPAAWNPVTAAQASVSISINFNTFYRDLSDDGDWVYFRGRYVWVPGDRPYGWRPYMYGHWAWTRPYGWMWVSEESFGWATYHYGRWGYSYAIGWYWVPGTRWAPAWVTWANDDDNIIWAPLPPGADDFDVDFAYGDMPDYYWNCVPARRFLDDDISVAVIVDFGARRRILADVNYAGAARFRNNVVVNAAIDLNFVERRSNRKVRVFDVESASKPGRTVAKGDHLAVFQGKVEGAGQAKPAKLRDVSEVEKLHAKRKDRITQDKTTPEVLGRRTKIKDVPPPGTAEGQTESLSGNKKNRKVINGQTGEVTGQTPETGNAGGQPLSKKEQRKLRKRQIEQQNQPDDVTNGAMPEEQFQQPANGNKKKRKLQEQQLPDQQQSNGQGSADEGQQANKKKQRRLQQQQQQEDSGGQMSMPDEQQPAAGNRKQRLKKKDGGNGAATCDPSVDPNCMAQPQ